MLLSELKDNEYGIITKVRGRGAFRKRILEMGFVKGKKVTVIKNAPLRDPVQYNILGYDISIRRSEASLIEVAALREEEEIKESFKGMLSENVLKASATKKSKTINVALVGNPNCGKTTIFNFASRSKEHVGNYGGVTIDSKTATFKQHGYTFNITDLPGTYSLSYFSPEERYVRDFILNNIPDVVINIVDASNLERNLFLTTQLIDMDVKVICALNMFDELKKKNDQFDYDSLGKMIGIPFIPTVGSKGQGLKELFDEAIKVYNDEDPVIRHIHINYGDEIENSTKRIQDKIKLPENYNITDKYSSRYLSLQLLEKDSSIKNVIEQCSNPKEILETTLHETKRIEVLFNNEEISNLITDAKYGFIAGALKETYKKVTIDRIKNTELIDTFLTHKFIGFPVFIFLMWLMFQSTFSLGQYPMDWIDKGIKIFSTWLESIMAAGPLKDLLIGGIISGVGGVIVFLPNILILFFFISFMEDTGYMARAAFIMDKLMHKIGLHGKSFIPLIMGFGCNVPAIMATRTIENRNNRILTILINPLMSCSARLPVYILLIGTFFPKKQGLILFSVYFIGVLLAVLISILFKKLFFKADDVPFVMELPPYRMPTLRSTIKHMWGKGAQYLQKMGSVILIASIIIWALQYFPRNADGLSAVDAQISVLKNLQSNLVTKNRNIEYIRLDKAINKLQHQKEAIQLEGSYLGQIGKLIEPAIHPLGFDWRMGICLISGVAAKEIVISTMGVLFQSDDIARHESHSLSEKLKTVTWQGGNQAGKILFSPFNAFLFILFILIYFPCIAVIAAIKKETGSWKWAWFTVFYTTALAYLLVFVLNQVHNLIV